MFFHNKSSRNLGQTAPELPRLSIESGSLHLDLEAGGNNPYMVPVASSSNALVPYKPSRPTTAVSTTFSMTSSAFNFAPPPPVYLGAYEKEALSGYLTPPHAGGSSSGVVTEVESVYEVHELSLLDRFQASHQLRMLFILLLSFIIIGGIAAAVLVLLAKKA
ncbi:hypothetical protein TWF694_009710 [Orbilia ellipsospora]|uniref:Uncharacterized protein n=1 Tax=Orbilia ellipsospora TaxID=2528407 RepID=A0AAV9XC50_9PEZI